MTVAIDERTTNAPTDTFTRWLAELARVLEACDLARYMAQFLSE